MVRQTSFHYVWMLDTIYGSRVYSLIGSSLLGCWREDSARLGPKPSTLNPKSLYKMPLQPQYYI